jgi:putative tryptophan/tyrosine transport system substrate-binding protein
MIDRRYFVQSTTVGMLLVSRLVAAETTKQPRVAFVLTAVPAADIGGPDPVDPYARAFLQGMRDQGLVDGHDVRIVLRTAEGNLNRFDALMREMVELDVKVIVTFNDAVPAAQRASRTIPIVALTGDPIAMGIADSLAHPGHNVTGIGFTGLDFFLKKLQLLKEAAPRITRVAELSFRPLAGSSDAADEIAAAAAAKKRLGLDLLVLRAETPQELETAFEQLTVDRVDALYADYNSFNFANRHRIAALAVR